jgi:hypothetical protein
MHDLMQVGRGAHVNRHAKQCLVLPLSADVRYNMQFLPALSCNFDEMKNPQ